MRKSTFRIGNVAAGRYPQPCDRHPEFGHLDRLDFRETGGCRRGDLVGTGIDQQQFALSRRFTASVERYSVPVAADQPVDHVQTVACQIACGSRGSIEGFFSDVCGLPQHTADTRNLHARQADLCGQRRGQSREKHENQGNSEHRLCSLSQFALSMDETGGVIRLIHGRQKTLNPSFEQDLLAMLPRLRRFAVGLCGNPADGDDLCQMSIERALANRDKWQAGTRLDSWMYRIMRNLWIDEGRATTRRRETFVTEEAGLSVGGEGAQESAVELSMVDRAMQQLPDEQREAVLLVMVEGYAYKEAAEIVGCPVGTLNSRLVRGRDALLEMLGEKA